jgi:hypothetical protein
MVTRVGVVVGRSDSECTEQDGAHEGERHTDSKHIQLHGKVHAILLAV